MFRKRKPIPGVDAQSLIKDAAKAMPDPTRRAFLRGGASVGALVFLSGCDIVDGASADKALSAISRWNDRVQALIFNLNRLAPTYPESAITRPFPFNAYYDEDDAPVVNGPSFRLRVGGLVENKRAWSLPELYALPAGDADHPPHLRRGLERDRQVERCPPLGIFETDRRRHARQIHPLQMRRGLFDLDRHGDRAASADADDVPLRGQDPTALLWLPDENSACRPSSASKIPNTWSS